MLVTGDRHESRRRHDCHGGPQQASRMNSRADGHELHDDDEKGGRKCVALLALGGLLVEEEGEYGDLVVGAVMHEPTE